MKQRTTTIIETLLTMKKSTTINNVKALEKEISRLKVEAAKIEARLDENFDYLQRHGWSMAFHSLSSSACRGGKENGFWASFFKSEPVHATMGSVASKVAEILAEAVEKILSRKNK